jgi:hypothetical protein
MSVWRPHLAETRCSFFVAPVRGPSTEYEMRAIMCNQDVVFVANAASVDVAKFDVTKFDVTKFLDLLNVITVTGSNGRSLATQVRHCCGAGGTTTVTRIQ